MPTMSDDVERLDFSGEPPGTTELEIQSDRYLIPDPARARHSRWQRYRENNRPPGLRPHPWRETGMMFACAFVTPIGFTIPDTVGVSRFAAYAVAWRWYGLRLAVVASGKGKGDLFEWPKILDLPDRDLFLRIDHAVVMETVDAG